MTNDELLKQLDEKDKFIKDILAEMKDIYEVFDRLKVEVNDIAEDFSGMMSVINR